mmetsp:Transcript_127/g.157  ORF Transcript_127/g.157 Transcript_127/m.157 type:complete len:259 (+) Transcript_127:969-1745(+)
MLLKHLLLERRLKDLPRHDPAVPLPGPLCFVLFAAFIDHRLENREQRVFEVLGEVRSVPAGRHGVLHDLSLLQGTQRRLKGVWGLRQPALGPGREWTHVLSIRTDSSLCVRHLDAQGLVVRLIASVLPLAFAARALSHIRGLDLVKVAKVEREAASLGPSPHFYLCAFRQDFAELVNLRPLLGALLQMCRLLGHVQVCKLQLARGGCPVHRGVEAVPVPPLHPEDLLQRLERARVQRLVLARPYQRNRVPQHRRHHSF